jgi:hypothetical protein
MDAIAFFRLRYDDLHTLLIDDLLRGLTDEQVRGRPQPGVNTIAWLLWHMARIEDVGVNRFVSDRPQVLEDWRDRLGVARRDVGTGMTDAAVDDLSGRVDLRALRGYWDAVAARTRDVVGALRPPDLESAVAGERVRHVVAAEGIVAPGQDWLTEFWAGGRSRGWVLSQMPFLHVYGHCFEARVAKGLWGVRSP